MLTIDEIKEKIAPLCREYGIERAWLFGSYARGDATEESDVDIRVEEKPETTSCVDFLKSVGCTWTCGMRFKRRSTC